MSTVKQRTCAAVELSGVKGDSGCRKSRQEPERPVRVAAHKVRANGVREPITAPRLERESDGLVVATKRSNVRGAKEPCQEHGV